MTDPVLIGPVDAPELHVMTYNVRRRFRNLRPGSPDRWDRRKWLMRRILAAEQPTVLGVQEALADQVRFVAESLGAHYRWVGHGSNPSGEGERCAVFYDSRRLVLSRWRQRALSANPDVPGSRTWGNITPRVVVIADFTDLATGRRLMVFNSHFDHISRRSRFASARMIRRLAVAEHGRELGDSIVVMGDINADADSMVHRQLTADGMLRDTWDAAFERLGPQWGTFSNYARRRPGGRRIDVILVGPGVEVLRTGINAVRFDGAAASDHEPVQAVIRLGPPGSTLGAPGTSSAGAPEA
jgi:endonuclease/exonuclease/phosphatase family metal-dependent hydrolase